MACELTREAVDGEDVVDAIWELCPGELCHLRRDRLSICIVFKAKSQKHTGCQGEVEEKMLKMGTAGTCWPPTSKDTTLSSGKLRLKMLILFVPFGLSARGEKRRRRSADERSMARGSAELGVTGVQKGAKGTTTKAATMAKGRLTWSGGGVG